VIAASLVYRILGGLAIAAVLCSGAYVKGCSDGKSRGMAIVQKRLDLQRKVWDEGFAKQEAETRRVETAWNLEKERTNALQAKLGAATTRGIDTARRLREYASRSERTLPEVAGSPGDSDGASGVGSQSCVFADGVGEALENHFGACARDAERLTEWQRFYEGLRKSQ
jgi:hypothetical protein